MAIAMSHIKERNYEFAQEMSETVITPKGKPANLALYKYKAKAIAIKLKMLNQ